MGVQEGLFRLLKKNVLKGVMLCAEMLPYGMQL